MHKKTALTERFSCLDYFVCECAHDAPTSRSSPDILNKQFDRLAEIAEEITEEKMKQELELEGV